MSNTENSIYQTDRESLVLATLKSAISSIPSEANRNPSPLELAIKGHEDPFVQLATLDSEFKTLYEKVRINGIKKITPAVIIIQNQDIWCNYFAQSKSCEYPDRWSEHLSIPRRILKGETNPLGLLSIPGSPIQLSLESFAQSITYLGKQEDPIFTPSISSYILLRLEADLRQVQLLHSVSIPSTPESKIVLNANGILNSALFYAYSVIDETYNTEQSLDLVRDYMQKLGMLEALTQALYLTSDTTLRNESKSYWESMNKLTNRRFLNPLARSFLRIKKQSRDLESTAIDLATMQTALLGISRWIALKTLKECDMEFNFPLFQPNGESIETINPNVSVLVEQVYSNSKEIGIFRLLRRPPNAQQLNTPHLYNEYS